jgi:hypothetical protein
MTNRIPPAAKVSNACLRIIDRAATDIPRRKRAEFYRDILIALWSSASSVGPDGKRRW